MPADSDLREIYRLQAECFGNYVVHTTYQSDRARNVRKVKVERRWDNATRIGHGSFGEVWLQKSKGDERAVKVLSKYRMEDLGIDYRKELDAMACFSRPRIREEQVIVAFLGWFESNDSVFLAMEYVPLGDLSKYITTGEIKEHDAKQITRDVLEALMIIHDEGFTHRDIKPQNVFVMQKDPLWWVKLGDFGITKRIDNEQTALRTRIGTARYLAPEIEDDDFPDSEYTQAVDMWSLGCLVYTILARKPPFMTMSSKKKPFPEEELRVRSSADALNFIRPLLSKIPAERPTAKDARSSNWLLDSDEPLGQDILGGSPQIMPLRPKDSAERLTAGDDRSNQTPAHASSDQTVRGGSTESHTLFPRSDAVPPPRPQPTPVLRPVITRPVFGISLEALFKRDGNPIPLVMQQCVLAVDLYGTELEGIYRISGRAAQYSHLKTLFNTDPQTLDFRNPVAFSRDITYATDLLKQFLRELPDPLLTKSAYQTFIEAARIYEDLVRRDTIHAAVNDLPDANYACIRFLVLHLHRVMEHSATNKMTAENLAVVFGPLLMGNASITEAIDTVSITEVGWQVGVVDTILSNCYQIFDDDD